MELECKFAGSRYSTMFPWLRRGIPWYLVESSAIAQGAEIDPGWVDSVRKLRLLPLSFLATQSLETLSI